MTTRALSLVTAILATAIPGHAATIYSESFPGGTSILPMNTTGINWNAKRNGATYATGNTDSAIGPVIGQDSGNRYLVHVGSIADKGAHLWWVGEGEVVATDYDLLTTINFALACNSSSQSLRVAIRSGGDWFVSQATFSHLGSNGQPATFGAKQLDFTSAGWNALDFGTLAVGATGDPTDGEITNFGFYSGTILGNIRIDNIEVAAIPEPSAWWFALGGAGLLLRRRRNR